MIALNHDSDEPLYYQIYNAIRADIATKALAPGQKLPSIRRLAEDLRVSRNTVEAAYQQLHAEGYVKSRSGSGFIVEDLDFSLLIEASKHGGPEDGTAHGLSPDENPRPDDETPCAPFVSEPFNEEPHFTYDFTYGDRPRGSFPDVIWKNLTGEALFDVSSKAYRYSNGAGEPELRQEIASRLKVSRGVHCLPEQVVLQPGTQAALSNLLTLFDPATDLVAVEEPGYDGANQVFANRGFRMTSIPVRRGKTQAEREHHACEALEASGAKLAFCTPSNQFPTGETMSLAMRIRLIEWAAREDAYILEDDYCREFRYESRPIPSLQSLDTLDRVVYMGTFSKVLSPALRMSYLVLPPKLLRRWRERFDSYYCPVPWLSQRVVYLFVANGHWDRYTRKTMAEYRARHDVLMKSIKEEMGDRVDVCGGSAGLHILLSTRDGRTQEELIEAAAREDVRVYETRKYWREAPYGLENHVLVGFSSIEKHLIPEGIRRLRKAWFGDDAPAIKFGEGPR